MRRFTFPLDTLLEVRRRAEDEVKRELARTIGKLGEAREQLAALSHELSAMQKATLHDSRASASVLVFRHTVAYRHKLKRDMLQKGRDIESLQEEEAGVRRRLVAATQQRRAIELVREKRYRQWRKAYRSEEQEFTDDVSQKAFVRRNNAKTARP